MEDESLAQTLSRNGPVALKAEATSKCGSWHVPIPDIIRSTPVDLVSGYPVYDRDLISAESLNSTIPITLIGDAAHPMSPFKGQGANQALLDALSLARILYAECRQGAESSLTSAIEKYHKEMSVRSAEKVMASAEAAQFLHTSTALQQGNITRGAAAANVRRRNS